MEASTTKESDIDYLRVVIFVFPKLLERDLLLYRALILAQSVVSGGLVGPIKIHQIQGTRAFSGSPQKSGCLLSLWSDSN